MPKTISVSLVAVSFLLISVGMALSGDKYSGFMEDYPKFQPDKDRKGALIYNQPGTSLKNYNKIIIDSIEIWISPKSKYKGINPHQLKALADSFRQVIIDELEPDYPVVSKPGPGVLGLRLAITDLHMKKKKRGLLGYTPIGFAATTAKNLAAGPSISLVDAVIEAEMLDAKTNERIGALIDRQSASWDQKNKKLTTWTEIEKVLKFYAKRFRGRMDAAHGR
jgi:hypothetical protein